MEVAHTAIHTELHKRYLTRRDGYREADEIKPRPPFWTTATCSMAARQFSDPHRRTYAQQTRITKMIYDHYFHGENRVKGVSDNNRRDELSACLLCSAPDSEEHGIRHCPGPMNSNLLEQIRTDTTFEITQYINSLRPGLPKSMAETYRDLALSPTYTNSQPQRVWKGMLSPNQLNVLIQQHNITPDTPHDPMLLKCMKHIQRLLATSYTKIRTQLTAYMFPSKYTTPPSEPPTAAQSATISERLTQPTINTLFPSLHINLRQPDTRSVFRSILNTTRKQEQASIHDSIHSRPPKLSRYPQAQLPTTHTNTRITHPTTKPMNTRIIHPTTKPTGLYFSSEWNPDIDPLTRSRTQYPNPRTSAGTPPLQHTLTSPPRQHDPLGTHTANPCPPAEQLQDTHITTSLRQENHQAPTKEQANYADTAVHFFSTNQSPSGFQSPNPTSPENVFNGALDGD